MIAVDTGVYMTKGDILTSGLFPGEFEPTEFVYLDGVGYVERQEWESQQDEDQL